MGMRGSKAIDQTPVLLQTVLTDSDKARVLKWLESLVEDKIGSRLGAQSKAQLSVTDVCDQIPARIKRKAHIVSTSWEECSSSEESPPDMVSVPCKIPCRTCRLETDGGVWPEA